MSELKRKELIRSIGVSNFPPKLMMQALTKDEIIANQVEYHPFLGQKELIELSGIYNIFLIAYSPLAKGQVMESEVLERISKNMVRMQLK